MSYFYKSDELQGPPAQTAADPPAALAESSEPPVPGVGSAPPTAPVPQDTPQTTQKLHGTPAQPVISASPAPPVAVPAQPSIVQPPVAVEQASDADKPSGFWANLQRSKEGSTSAPPSTEQAHTAPPPQPIPTTPDAAAESPQVSAASAGEAAAVQSAVSAAPVVPSAAQSTEAAPSQKGGFWARLQAAKAEKSDEPDAQTPAPAPAPAPAPEPAPAPAGGGGFWARLQAQKQAAAGSAQHTAAVTGSAQPAAHETFEFTAPDGTGFHDKHKYRQYMYRAYYSFSKAKDKTLVKLPGEVDGQQFGMSDLDNCTALLCDFSDAVTVERCHNSKILIAASSGSVFIRNCTNCTITLACKQLRTRDMSDCKVFLYSKTDPVIEATSRLQVATFNAACPDLDKAFAKANLQPHNNHYRRVFDFHKGSGAYAMPHWSFLPDDAWEDWTVDLTEHGVHGTPVNPVPRDAVADPSTVLEAGGVSQVAPTTSTQSQMLSFDIRTTTAEQAAASMQA